MNEFSWFNGSLCGLPASSWDLRRHDLAVGQPPLRAGRYERVQRTVVRCWRALATVRVEQGWTAITSEHFTGSTAASDASAELGTISRSLDDFNFKLARGYAMQGAPHELGNLTRSQMRDLVEAS